MVIVDMHHSQATPFPHLQCMFDALSTSKMMALILLSCFPSGCRPLIMFGKGPYF
jgi:hypothetical protein